MKSDLTKMIAIFFTLSLLSIGCDQATSPNPSVNTVSHKEIPRPYSETTYFMYGQELDSGEKTIFDRLNSEGFILRDAWIPNESGECGMLIIQQMIVRLEYPDSRIYSLGFVSDSSQIAAGVCIPSWKHYTFKK